MRLESCKRTTLLRAAGAAALTLVLAASACSGTEPRLVVLRAEVPGAC